MELSAEQTAIRDTVREVATEEIRPIAAAADRDAEFPEEVWETLADLGMTAMTVPEEYGGLDLEMTTYSIVNEEVAYGALAVATALGVHGLATSCLAEFGDEDLKEAWLPEMAEGRPVGAFALSEPEAGSNPAEMSTVARPEGDEYVIDGEKQWITNGRRSGVVILFAKTDPDDPRSVTQFLVPKDADGLTVGKEEDKMGLRASDTTSLTFDGVRIPATYRLTEEGEGLSAALHILNNGRVGIASQAVGLAQAAFDDAVAYARERDQFGQSIAEFQALRHDAAEMQTNIAAARELAREAARLADDGEDYRHAAARAKLFATETAVDVTETAVQFHGGYGYTKDFDVERYYRDAKVTTIYEGTSEIQKDIIARGIFE
ncbi:Acyl-CoA dehydrogenase [Halanaeroarchaeum sp. HSR-CO]|uniref:acyl-CoA dehydrogenase family protein n=1 Tax=Halanaeroarchaeum sp. HSR-CO TaxID=2866382 RepID=UPI00217EB067|nr:acyl-CoA dehydrogenase family protein [Halanaeroarchaeum sp. HSR-CO]UWG48474.1 Acyl-CoA dehydrogenase [Halanaeroarchaeum sp. HSR-CO]